MSVRRNRQLAAIAAGMTVVFMSGCADVNYAYYIPEGQNDCPTGTIYRSGGTGIVDRDGGTGIVDRNGQEVSTFCEVQVCPNGNLPVGDAGMVWHQDKHQQMLNINVCPP